MKIFLIRHGETDYNKKDLLIGQLDVPLNEKGRTEAKTTADFLTGKGISKIFCSSLSRACETANIIASKLDIPVFESDELMEHTLGKLDGIALREFLDKLKSVDDFEELMISEEGEAVTAFKKRIWKKFLQIAENNKDDGNILVVTHGGATRVIFGKIFDSKEIIFDTLAQGNCCINIINYNEEEKKPKFVVELVNYTYHIK